MASRTTAKSGSTKPGSLAHSQPKAILDPGTAALTAKSIYEAAKAGIDLSTKLYEATKGAVAVVCAVHESLAIDDRYRLRLRLSSVCPHSIAINSITALTPKGVPVDLFLMRSAGSGLDSASKSSDLQPPVSGKVGKRFADAFVIPPMATQEVVVEVKRADVQARIHNRRGGELAVNYNVLGDDGDESEAKVKVLFRDDQPLLAGYGVIGS
jgi:hypothetical protein